MSFEWPGLLWLLFLVPVLALLYVWAQRRRRKYAARFASLIVVKDALGKGPGLRRHIPIILFLLGLTVGIVALGRPSATVSLPSNRGTVILAIDISGSMRAHDIKPSRIEAAKAAARSFIEKQPHRVRVGIVAFAGTAALVQAPTTVRDDLYAAIDRLYPQRATAVGSGIMVALNAIFEDEKKLESGGTDTGSGTDPNSTDPNANGGSGTDPNAQSQPSQDQPLGSAPPPDQAQQPVAPGSYTSAAIVLLSDGQTNTGPDPLDAAQQAADKGVRIFTVGVGTNQGDVVGAEGRYFRVSLDEDTLKKIAHNTAGAYYKASDESELMRIYNALSVRLIVGKDTLEVTALFAALALAAFLLGGFLSQLWFNRL